MVAVSLVLAGLVIVGGFAAYWFLLSSHRYVGTYKLTTISAGGMSIEIEELGKTMGSLGGVSGGASPTIEVLLELKSDGTGSMNSSVTGLSGPLASLAGAGTSQSQPLKWRADGRGIVVDADAGAAAAANPLAMSMANYAGTTSLDGQLAKGKLTLSVESPNPAGGGQPVTTSMVFVRK